MSEQKNNKGAASFWVPRKAIEALLKAKATAAEITAYLTIAKHTPVTGDYSTAGAKAVRTKSGMSVPAMERTIESLLSIDLNGSRAKTRQSKSAKKFTRLVYTAEDWTRLTGEVLPHGPGQRSKTRFVLNTFRAYDELEGDFVVPDMIWFGANLVAGVDSFERPLYALRQCGDRAAWLLMLLYIHNAMDEWGGVSPVKTAFVKYTQGHRSDVGRTNYSISHWEREGPTVWTWVSGSVTAGLSGEKDEYMDVFWKALNSLTAHGFIYEVVTVTTAQAGEQAPHENDFPLYELDARSLHGYKPKGEEGVAGETAMIARDLGYPVTDGEGQFYGKYAAIAPTGTPIRVIGIYRLRFRVANPKNAYVTDAWKQISERQKEAEGWIADVRQRAHLIKPETEEAKSDDELDFPF
jgi:hypothetical protein